MRHVLNVIRFLIFLPLCFGLLWGMYWCIGKMVGWLLGINLFWIILILFFGATLIVGFGTMIFGFLAGLLSYVNPYKKIGGWIVIPLAILFALFNIYITWAILDLSFTKNIVVALIVSALITYCTIAFSSIISAQNPKEFIE